MNLNQIPFGLLLTSNELVDVSDVESGKNCKCICPSCKTPLIARQGSIKVWHFAHASKNVYEKTENECDFSFYISVRLMAKQLINEKLTLTLPEFYDTIELREDRFGNIVKDKFLVTEEKEISITDIKIETNFFGIIVDLVGNIEGYNFVVYFVHPGRKVPPELSLLDNRKCGVISVDFSSLPELFIKARREGTSYKEALMRFLSHEKESKKWIFHPNFQRAKANAIEALKRRFENERKLAKFTCVMCKVDWDGFIQGGNICPKCGDHLYSKQI
ncbi:MAG: hypothetical protein IPN42_10055 [Methylococcaceae bacterium]|nr:hypothetical protein [Methylococcaceae bacterium]